MSELHALVPVFNVGTPILSVLFSLTYDQKHFGFSTYDIVNSSVVTLIFSINFTIFIVIFNIYHIKSYIYYAVVSFASNYVRYFFFVQLLFVKNFVLYLFLILVSIL